MTAEISRAGGTDGERASSTPTTITGRSGGGRAGWAVQIDRWYCDVYDQPIRDGFKQYCLAPLAVCKVPSNFHDPSRIHRRKLDAVWLTKANSPADNVQRYFCGCGRLQPEPRLYCPRRNVGYNDCGFLCVYVCIFGFSRGEHSICSGSAGLVLLTPNITNSWRRFRNCRVHRKLQRHNVDTSRCRCSHICCSNSYSGRLLFLRPRRHDRHHAASLQVHRPNVVVCIRRQ
jgi:hypothetical protein